MADYRAAITACILANVNRKVGAPMVKHEDFFPSLKVKTKKMSPAQIKKHMSTIAKSKAKKG